MAKRHVTRASTALASTHRPVADGAATQAKATRPAAADGFVNLAAGLGGPRDKRSVGGYAVPIRLDQQTLENIYAGGGIAGKIVDTPAGDMTRAGWTRSWDDADKDPNVMRQVDNAEKKTQLQSRAHQALKWGGLYGGCLLVAMMRGANMAEPLKLESVKKNSLLRFQVLDRWRVTPSSRIDDNPESPGFGLPLFYTMAESSVVIHNSRVARFIGRDAPYWRLRAESFWGDSILQRVWDAIRNFDGTEAAIASLVLEANVDVVAMEGLREMLAETDGEAKVRSRLMAAHTIKSILNTLVIDGGKDGTGGDKFQQKTITFSGLPQVREGLMTTLAGIAEMPVTLLFGKSPGGLNSTGDNEISNYDDHVASRQREDLGPQLDWADEILVRSTLGYMPENYERKFNPLRQMTEKERADIEKLQADRDHIYLVDGVITEHLVARELKARGTYLTMTDEDVELAEEASLEPEPAPVVPGKTPPAPGTTEPADPNAG
jgi:phage-related protein (TIGR01555 family)